MITNGTVASVVSVTGTDSLDLSNITGGTPTVVTHRRFCRRIVTQGLASEAVTFVLNGTQVSLAGGTELNSISVGSLTMVSGTGVMCFVITTPAITNF